MKAFVRRVFHNKVLVAIALLLILEGGVAFMTQAEASQILDIFSSGTSWELPCCLEEWQNQCSSYETAFAYCGAGCNDCDPIQCLTDPPLCLF